MIEFNLQLIKGKIMTYSELSVIISKMTNEEKNNDVTIYISNQDEYYPLVNDYPIVQCDDGILDNGSYYLVI